MEAKSNKNYILKGHNWSLDCSQPIIMGILNITPDSFYDGGKNNSTSSATAHAIEMIEEGASIIDIGGQSTRPDSIRISPQEELDRIGLTISTIKDYNKNIIISVDTYHSYVAREAITLGAHIINDISAGEMDEKMLTTIADLNVPYIMMHMQGTPNTMQQNPSYKNVVEEIINYFKERVARAEELGINEMILDPGFGFGKTIPHNFEILTRFQEFNDLNKLTLAGISRKSFIYKTLQTTAERSLTATSALHLQCLLKGANILRVHDVKEAKEVIALYQAM